MTGRGLLLPEGKIAACKKFTTETQRHREKPKAANPNYKRAQRTKEHDGCRVGDIAAAHKAS